MMTKKVTGRVVVNLNIFGNVYCLVRESNEDKKFRNLSKYDERTLLNISGKKNLRILVINRKKLNILLRDTDYVLLTDYIFTTTDMDKYNWSDFSIPTINRENRPFSYSSWDLIGNSAIDDIRQNEKIGLISAIRENLLINSDLESLLNIDRWDQSAIETLGENIYVSHYDFISDKKLICLGIFIPYTNAKRLYKQISTFFLSFPLTRIYTNSKYTITLFVLHLNIDISEEIREKITNIKEMYKELNLIITDYFPPSNFNDFLLPDLL